MLAQQDDVFMEAYETISQQNQDDNVRMWCEAYEETERVARTIEQDHEREIAQRDAKIAEQGAEIADLNAKLARLESILAEKNVH